MGKSTIRSADVATSDNTAPQLPLGFDESDAAEAFLDRWKDEGNESSPEATEVEEKKKKPEPPAEEAEQDQEEAAEDADESAEDDTDPDEEESSDTEDDTEEESEEGEQEEESAKKTLDDDAEVEVKVDDEVLKVSVKDLKRLYGQEAALTKKSQQVAAKRKEVEATEQKLAASMERVYKKAAERWEPYSKIDMLVASKQLEADQFAALRAEAQAAWEDFNFISQEADAFVKQAQAARQEQMQKAAQEAVKVLKDTIPGWSQSLYDNIREYAVTQGMDSEIVNNLVDPIAIQLIHKARLYDESKKVVTKKKVLTPKKVVKTTVTPSAKDMSPSKDMAAQRLRATGDVDDAAEVFLSRWQS
jgi:hypothetical protein